MNRSIFKFPSPAEPLQFEGERYTSAVEGAIQHEHYHRYLFALRYCVDKNVLDVASGEGYGTFLLGQVGRSVIGVDIDQKAVDFANKNYVSERICYRRGDAAKLPIEDQSIDVVVSFETVEHFANQTEFIMEVDRVLRPDGLVIISSPNRDIYSVAQNYRNPFHVREMNRREFVDLLSLRFSQIHLLEQGAVHGSLISLLPEEETDSVEGFTTSDGQLFERLTGVPGAPYFLALAARVPVPPPSQSVLHADLFHEQIERRFAALEQVRQKQAEAHSQHVQRMGGVEALLRAEIAAHQEQGRIAARRNQLAAEHIEQMQSAIHILRERLVSQEHDAAKCNIEMTEQRELLIRRLASTQTTNNAEVPLKSRGLRNFIRGKVHRRVDDYRVVATSPLFDQDWYLKENPRVAAAHLDPVLHYLHHGAAEDRQPGPFFDAREYGVANPDVVAAKMNPLLHFLKYGVYEGRPLKLEALPSDLSSPVHEPDPIFDAAFLTPFYTAAGQSDKPWIVWLNLSATGPVLPTTPAAAEALAAAVRHNPVFNSEFYARRLPEGMDPAVHYVVIGEALGWAPSESFDPKFYLARYPDIKAANISPLMHYQIAGQAEGRVARPESPLPPSALSGPMQQPKPIFDAAFLTPFYAAAGQSDKPWMVWLNLSTTGPALPTTQEAAESSAAAVRQNPFFDSEFYARRLPEGMDPAVHYVVIGKALGWAPSESFDPEN